MRTQHALFILAIAALAGCASQPPAVPGKFLVYRDSSGAAIRQFDYPSEDFCRKVEMVAGGGARCQPDSIGPTMHAKATLIYNPPGVYVESHYADMARCQTDTRTMAAGVQLIAACAAK